MLLFLFLNGLNHYIFCLHSYCVHRGACQTCIVSPQDCVLSPELFCLFTSEVMNDEKYLILCKYADDMAMADRQQKTDLLGEAAYLVLQTWCQLEINMAKEPIICIN